MSLSNYARKQMLKKVASQFTMSEVEWLSTQNEFNRLCLTSDTHVDIIDLGRRLLKHKSSEKKLANPVMVPDIPAVKS